MTAQGLIVKANSGFYYVKCGESAGNVAVECRARGIFRMEHKSPLVGDRVMISRDGDKGTVEEILPRKNSLVRPPVANIDMLVIVVSTTQPVPNLLVIDRLIVTAEQKGIEPVIVISKGDLCAGDDICAIYKKAGITSFAASGVTGEGIEKLRGLIAGRIGAFTGNSGVGKSTILNRLDSSLTLETGEISKKLGRGRHTTRIVELFSACGGYIADTPGFASLDTGKFDPVLKEDLQFAFREFAPYIGRCRFTGCSHTKEDGCAVIEAVKNTEIAASRHKSYCEMYEEAKGIKEWELKK
jgi:ribosome biogenesis GTPase / thiamine phosphate phosphatase